MTAPSPPDTQPTRSPSRFAARWPLGLARRNALLFALGFVVLILAIHLLDHPLSLWGQGLPQPLRRFFRWMTQWGESDWILVPSLIALVLAWLLSLVTRDRIRAALREVFVAASFIFLGVGLPSLVATLLKRLIGRGRPTTWTAEAPLAFQWNWSQFDYQSFPSGHATTAFSLALVITFLWPRAFWPALAFALLVALSRVVIGAHYPTDITAGGILGILGAYAVRNIFASRGWLFSADANGHIERQPFSALAGLLRR